MAEGITERLEAVQLEASQKNLEAKFNADKRADNIYKVYQKDDQQQPLYVSPLLTQEYLSRDLRQQAQQPKRKGANNEGTKSADNLKKVGRETKSRNKPDKMKGFTFSGFWYKLDQQKYKKPGAREGAALAKISESKAILFGGFGTTVFNTLDQIDLCRSLSIALSCDCHAHFAKGQNNSLPLSLTL